MSIENIDFSNHDLIGQQEHDETEIFVSSLSPIDPISTKSQLRNWLDPDVDIRGIVLHHTFSPTTCNGVDTIYAIRNYHLNSGFSDIAANFYSSDEQDVIGYTARSLYKSNYAHSYINKPWSEVPNNLGERFGYDKMWCNKNAFGLETIGNFDNQNPKTSVAMKHSIMVMSVVCEVYNLDPNNDLWPHRMFEYKSCPGNLVSMDWIKQEVTKEMGNGEDCKDIPAKDYQIEALQWGKDTGLMVGDGINQFPGCNITRGDFITILYRFYNDFVKDN